jgi:oligoribonuclease
MKLVWLDLETTGLDPLVTQVLEVAVAEADLHDPFNIKFIYEAVLPLAPTLISDLNPFIIDMHTKNGLLAECAMTTAKSRAQVDEELAQLVEWVDDKDERATLAGSSIHFDHSYIKVHLPLTNRKLSHRHYDVSALKLFCQSMGMPRFKKAEAHRAKEDIIESVTHARECAEWLKEHLR